MVLIKTAAALMAMTATIDALSLSEPEPELVERQTYSSPPLLN